MSEHIDLIEAQAEHIEDLEAELAELAELDARLDRKTKRRHYDTLATQRRSPDATVRAQDRVIAQLESELVRGYAELSEKVKRKRGKRDEPDEEAAITPAEPSIQPAIKEGLSILYWYVANPHKLELFVLSHSIPRRERAMQRAILAATYGPLALLACDISQQSRNRSSYFINLAQGLSCWGAHFW